MGLQSPMFILNMAVLLIKLTAWVTEWPFGLVLEVVGHTVTYFWGPGTAELESDHRSPSVGHQVVLVANLPTKKASPGCSTPI